MQRAAFVLKVKKNLINEYKIHHQNVWSEMKEALSRNGWKNYSLFLASDGSLFGYCEPEISFEDSLIGMSKEEINTDWQKLMSKYFEIPEGFQADQSLIKLEEIFHID
ncbi:MAG: L-rhamnose mutarotase [SAR202 cluster bacterium]|nr:L-rhamnose mutarotase [SAR202 cluster bacterium]MQG39310.1 L-rhamnose mutarotase [SAR202 cluster bacterium]|tara:strand:- start:46 stop:369 length:324 start_codon:yes stop_codon:yes gene_type:complete